MVGDFHGRVFRVVQSINSDKQHDHILLQCRRCPELIMLGSILRGLTSGPMGDWS